MIDVGTGNDMPRDLLGVQAVELWYSERRQLWVVERLSADADPIGPSHYCLDEAEAWDCLETWIRAYPDAEPILPAVNAPEAAAPRKAA